MLRPQRLLLCLLIIFAQLTHAETADEGCFPYTIVFGNGVGNSKEDALKSLNILTGLVGSKYKDKDVNYKIAYNPTDGPGAATILDVVEAAKQKAGENNSLWSLTWKVIFGVVNKAEPNQSWVTTVAQIWTDFNAKIMQGMRYNLAKQSSYYDATAASHVALYKALLTNKSDPQRVLLVAHSQGNLYGNIALQKLEQELLSIADGKKYLSRFAMVGVASAADFVYKDGPYLTSTYDGVINAVRANYPTVLLGNITLPAAAEYKTTSVNGEPVSIIDYTGHGFVTVYTNNTYAGRALLKNHIEKQLSSLKDEDDSANDYSTYKWYMATESSDGGLAPGNSNYPTLVSSSCFDMSWDQDCIDGYNLEQQRLFLTLVKQFAQTPCIYPCNKGENFQGGSAPSIRWPGEQTDFKGAWFVYGSGEDGLKQFVLPRIFNPANPAYIGFAQKDARIKYQKFDSTPYIYAQYPMVDPGPVTSRLILQKKVYVGVKACKAQT